jgi:hypothetical protein
MSKHLLVATNQFHIKALGFVYLLKNHFSKIIILRATLELSEKMNFIFLTVGGVTLFFCYWGK